MDAVAQLVGIVDFDMGNLASVRAAVESLGHVARIGAEPHQLNDVDRLILPGVGAFGDAMVKLKERKLAPFIADWATQRNGAVLGICLGAQLLCEASDEFGLHQGLNLLPAHVARLTPSDPAMRLPHVGWNVAAPVQNCRMFDGIAAGSLFYYVHSFRMVANDPSIVAAECDYGGSFTAMLQRGRMAAAQFHPEKSGEVGLRLLRNFLESA